MNEMLAPQNSHLPKRKRDLALASLLSPDAHVRVEPTPNSPFFYDSRNRTWRLTVSALVLYGVERWAHVSSTPTGLFFPLGYLLFWTFYYVYYRPFVFFDPRQEWAGTAKASWGLLIWLGLQLAGESLLQLGQRGARLCLRIPLNAKNRFLSRLSGSTNLNPTTEVTNALTQLGLKADCRSWSEVHARYRLLAKKFHPDVRRHERSTGAGMFYLIDSAYRNLLQLRKSYFR